MPGVLEKLFRESSDFSRLVRFFDEQADPWVSLEMPVAAQAFGLASHRDFGAYLEGPSRVPVASIGEICVWLQGCEALDDQSLFFQPDFWQHPVTFEHLRKGDCEDHALWAWRQLHRLDLRPLFTAGLWRGTPHTWVMFENQGVDCLLETTAKSGEMVQPLAVTRHLYCPALAVGADGRTFVYQGYQRFRASMAGPPKAGHASPS